MTVCHGCHGPIGGGAHQGSEFGRGVCTHPYSNQYQGGILEDGSWAPCRLGYSYDPNLVLANGTGFDSTLHTYKFQPGRPSSYTPDNLTGATAIPQVPPPPPLSGQSAVTHGQDIQLGDASGFSTLDKVAVDKPVGNVGIRPSTNMLVNAAQTTSIS